jgi:erythromycin esterase-like protein
MNKKLLTVLCLAGALAAATFVWAQSKDSDQTSSADSRMDRVLEQNEKILKNQEEILKQLSDIRETVMVLKRRSS